MERELQYKQQNENMVRKMNEEKENYFRQTAA